MLRSRTLSLFSFLVLILVIFLQGRASAQVGDCQCDPSPKVKAALEALPRYEDERVPPADFRQQQLQRLQGLLKKAPDDAFVHQRYQNAFTGFNHEFERPRLIAEYQARAEKHPQDPVSQYLYARALGTKNNKDALKVLEPALEQFPNCPQLHLLATELYQFTEQDKSRRHLAEFMRLCPESLQGYQYGRLIDEPAELQALATKLRKRLRGAKDIEAVTAYERLWKLEFRARPVAEHEQLRKQIQADLKLLRAQNRGSDSKWLLTLHEGYKYLQDEAGQGWVLAQLEQHFPYFSPTWWLLNERWRATHPYPDANATPEQKRAYYQASLLHAERMCQHLPHDYNAWFQRFFALQALDDSPDASFLAVPMKF